MKKYLILLSIALILFSCDRFEHTFKPETNNENYIIDFFTTFADSIASFPESISSIMSFYNEDYNNNGVTKLDVENFYTELSLLTPGTLDLEATLIDTTDNNIEWRLLASELSMVTYLDSMIIDVLLPTEDSFQFYGNQADMRNVVVELFTGQWCPNCPNAEEASHNLRMQYGSRFSYVEYHISDQLQPDFAFDHFNYYPNNSGLPFGIVNGNAHIIYSAPSIEEVQAEIQAAITPLLQEPIAVLLDPVVFAMPEL